MIRADHDINAYVAELDRVQNTTTERVDWLKGIRAEASERFRQLGFPTLKHEPWRYTNVTPIARGNFRRAERREAAVNARQVEPFIFGDIEAARLVFVNGYYTPELSRVGELPRGVSVSTLDKAIGEKGEQLESLLARQSSDADSGFVALNTALWADGAYINVSQGTVIDRPIHIVYVSAGHGTPTASYPRTLVIAETGSAVSIIESFVGVDEESCLTNAVTEIVAEANAAVDYDRIQRESDKAYHVGSLLLYQRRDSRVRTHSVSLGAALARHDVRAVLAETGCHCTLDGLYVVDDDRHIDNHLHVDHASPHCDSRERYRGILTDKARGVFAGRILVREDAQKTDAKQSNMNLLLSEDARVDARPQLEIFADDVKCTHGATVGQLDENAIFYLRARGIDEAAARTLLIHAFASESLRAIRNEQVRARLEAEVFDRLPSGQAGEDAV